MDNTHKKKRAVDKATAFTKWCGKDLKYPALLFLLMAFSSLIMFQDYLLGDQLMIFNDLGSDTWQQYIMTSGTEAFLCGIFLMDWEGIFLI